MTPFLFLLWELMHILSVFFPSLFVDVDVVLGFVRAIFPFQIAVAVSDTTPVFQGEKT